ncbi:MAG: hypothetical protein ACLP5E_30310 [Streptosporangiaceae bacterium]
MLSDPAAQERIAQSRDEIARGEGLSIAEVARFGWLTCAVAGRQDIVMVARHVLLKIVNVPT